MKHVYIKIVCEHILIEKKDDILSWKLPSFSGQNVDRNKQLLTMTRTNERTNGTLHFLSSVGAKNIKPVIEKKLKIQFEDKTLQDRYQIGRS